MKQNSRKIEYAFTILIRIARQRRVEATIGIMHNELHFEKLGK